MNISVFPIPPSLSLLAHIHLLFVCLHWFSPLPSSQSSPIALEGAGLCRMTLGNVSRLTNVLCVTQPYNPVFGKWKLIGNQTKTRNIRQTTINIFTHGSVPLHQNQMWKAVTCNTTPFLRLCDFTVGFSGNSNCRGSWGFWMIFMKAVACLRCFFSR